MTQKNDSTVDDIRPIADWTNYWTIGDCLDHLGGAAGAFGAWSDRRNTSIREVWPSLTPSERSALDLAFARYDIETGRV